MNLEAMVRFVPVALEDEQLRKDTLDRLPSLRLELQQAVALAYASASAAAKPAIGDALNALGADHPALREVAVGGETAAPREGIATVWNPAAYLGMVPTLSEWHDTTQFVGLDEIVERYRTMEDWLAMLTDRSAERSNLELGNIGVGMTTAGDIALLLGNAVGASARYGEALSLSQKLVDLVGETADTLTAVAVDHLRIGICDRDIRGDDQVAKMRFENALVIFERARELSGGHARSPLDIGQTLILLGSLALESRNAIPAARRHLGRALKLLAPLAEGPGAWRPSVGAFALAQQYYAEAQWRANGPSRSVRSRLKRSLSLHHRLIRDFGPTRESCRQLANCYAANAEYFERAEGKYEIALDQYGQALFALGQLTQQFSLTHMDCRAIGLIHQRIAELHETVGNLYPALTSLQSSVAMMQYVVELFPDSVRAKREYQNAVERLRRMEDLVIPDQIEILEEVASPEDVSAEESGGAGGEG